MLKRNHNAFTTLELVVAVAIVTVLLAIVLPKFYQLSLRAEALTVQGTIGTMRSALSMKMAHGLYRGDDFVAWTAAGKKPLYPMRDLLQQQQDNYLGVLTNSDRKGYWYDDSTSHEIVYVLRNDEIITGIDDNPKKVRWHIVAIYDTQSVDGIDSAYPQRKQGNLLGVALEPAMSYQWMFE